jgi:hypothetical protein
VLPDFFIAGAPKCGTTALSEYLRSHPNVLMAYPKEPHYFAEDFGGYRAVEDWEAYRGLFRRRARRHLVAGEASVWYLYSEVALRNIGGRLPDARIVVLLRDPIAMVRSLHTHFLANFYEDQPELARAWELQSERRQGRHLPPRCPVPAFLQYARVARLGEQVENLMQIFPADRVKCILQEDLAADPRATYLDVLDFLALPDDGRHAFPRRNTARANRLDRLAGLVQHPPPAMRRAWRALKGAAGPGVIRVAEGLQRLNTKPAAKVPLDAALRGEMAAEFHSDIARLAALIGRDLSHWGS